MAGDNKQQQKDMVELASQSIRKIKEVQGGDTRKLDEAVATVISETIK